MVLSRCAAGAATEPHDESATPKSTADIKRILDSATGTFYDDFPETLAGRSSDVVKQVAVQVAGHRHRVGPGVGTRRWPPKRWSPWQ